MANKISALTVLDKILQFDELIARLQAQAREGKVSVSLAVRKLAALKFQQRRLVRALQKLDPPLYAVLQQGEVSREMVRDMKQLEGQLQDLNHLSALSIKTRIETKKEAQQEALSGSLWCCLGSSENEEKKKAKKLLLWGGVAVAAYCVVKGR